MDEAITVQFDLTPPSREQFQTLVADLSDEERPVLLEHGTEAPFCGLFLQEKREGLYTLPPVRSAAVQGRHEVRKRYRMAKLHQPVLGETSSLYSRHQLRHDPH